MDFLRLAYSYATELNFETSVTCEKTNSSLTVKKSQRSKHIHIDICTCYFIFPSNLRNAFLYSTYNEKSPAQFNLAIEGMWIRKRSPHYYIRNEMRKKEKKKNDVKWVA